VNGAVRPLQGGLITRPPPRRQGRQASAADVPRPGRRSGVASRNRDLGGTLIVVQVVLFFLAKARGKL